MTCPFKITYHFILTKRIKKNILSWKNLDSFITHKTYHSLTQGPLKAPDRLFAPFSSGILFFEFVYS